MESVFQSVFERQQPRLFALNQVLPTTTATYIRHVLTIGAIIYFVRGLTESLYVFSILAHHKHASTNG